MKSFKILLHNFKQILEIRQYNTNSVIMRSLLRINIIPEARFLFVPILFVKNSGVFDTAVYGSESWKGMVN